MENLQNDMATNYEAFKETWLGEILADNPSSVQKGNKFVRKLLTQWLDFNQDSDEIFFATARGMAALMSLICKEAICKRKTCLKATPGI